MSETEVQVGKLVMIGPNNGESLEEAAVRILAFENHTMSKYDDSALECLEVDFYETYVVISDIIYKVDMNTKNDYDGIFEAFLNADGSISFTLKYYNGGCSFNEALEEAFKNMKTS